MIKQEKDMSLKELEYVKDCLKKLFPIDEITIERNYHYLAMEIYKTEQNISAIEEDLESLEQDELGILILIGGIFVSTYLYAVYNFDPIICIGIATTLFIIGNTYISNNKKKIKSNYVDLDTEKEKLEKFKIKKEKVLNLIQYNNSINDLDNDKEKRK